MSAYGHEMERGYSAQSLSSRGVSEMGSRYLVESGFYMTSFAALIFIGGLIVAGVLLTTLLIALSVMLQSCESRKAGLVEMTIDDYNYCKIFAVHVELNSLEENGFPSACKDVAIQHIKGGQYSRDLNLTVQMAEDYFNSVAPQDDGSDVVLVDIDDILPKYSHHFNLLSHRFDQYGCNDCVERARNLKHIFILKLYKKLQASGWPLIMLSRKPEKQQNATIGRLISAGFGGWSSLIMRFDDELQMDSHEYFSKRRAALNKQGFQIAGIISNHMDALSGSCLGKRIFKLPNPMYFNSEHHVERINL